MLKKYLLDEKQVAIILVMIQFDDCTLPQDNLNLRHVLKLVNRNNFLPNTGSLTNISFIS